MNQLDITDMTKCLPHPTTQLSDYPEIECTAKAAAKRPWWIWWWTKNCVFFRAVAWPSLLPIVRYHHCLDFTMMIHKILYSYLKWWAKGGCVAFVVAHSSISSLPWFYDDDLIGIFSSWAITNIQVGYLRKQEFHIRYNKLTTMVENKDHLL